MEKINLSDGEWIIMKRLWTKAPRTIGELVKDLENDTGWTKATVFVMLKRLIGKQAVRMDDSGHLQEYYPCILRSEAESDETDSFLSRVYDGSVSMMVSSMAGRKALTQEERDALRRILDEAEKQKED